MEGKDQPMVIRDSPLALMETSSRFNKILELVKDECEQENSSKCNIRGEIWHSLAPVRKNSDGDFEFVRSMIF